MVAEVGEISRNSSGLSKKRPCSIRRKFENCDAEACASQPQSSRYLEADEGDVRDELGELAEGGDAEP